MRVIERSILLKCGAVIIAGFYLVSIFALIRSTLNDYGSIGHKIFVIITAPWGVPFFLTFYLGILLFFIWITASVFGVIKDKLKINNLFLNYTINTLEWIALFGFESFEVLSRFVGKSFNKLEDYIAKNREGK